MISEDHTGLKELKGYAAAMVGTTVAIASTGRIANGNSATRRNASFMRKYLAMRVSRRRNNYGNAIITRPP